MIPNIIHFICIGGKAFTLIDYLAIKSANDINRPDHIYLHYDDEPTGLWWEWACRYLEPVHIVPPTEVADRPLVHPAHQADVARLEILLECGGIYLDLDVICVCPFTSLMNQSFILGQQGENGVYGLGNAVILSEPGAFFARKWREGFAPYTSYWQGFRSRGLDAYWDEMSVRYPSFLAGRFPEHISIQPYTSFYWPLYQRSHLKWLFEKRWDTFNAAYCHHLWATHSWDTYLKNITVDFILRSDCNFNSIVRRFLIDDMPPSAALSGVRCDTCWQI